MDEINGKWRTISGRRVFIKEGQSLHEAMKESGKFDKKQINSAQKIDALFEKKRKLERERAEIEIKEDLAKPIEKSKVIEEEIKFDPNDYNQIDNDSFNELAYRQNITKEEHDVLYDSVTGYIGTDFGQGINNSLRDPTLKMNFAQRKTKDTLQRVISKNKLEDNIKTTRYVYGDYLESEFGIKISRKKDHSEFLDAEKRVGENVNKVITNKGFMSVSATESNVFKDAEVKLNTYIKKGTDAFVTENTEESEIILNTNTKYRIIKAYNVTDEYGYNQLNIDIEVLK